MYTPSTLPAVGSRVWIPEDNAWGTITSYGSPGGSAGGTPIQDSLGGGGGTLYDVIAPRTPPVVQAAAPPVQQASRPVVPATQPLPSGKLDFLGGDGVGNFVTPGWKIPSSGTSFAPT